MHVVKDRAIQIRYNYDAQMMHICSLHSFLLLPNEKYGQNLPFCSYIMVLNKGQTGHSTFGLLDIRCHEVIILGLGILSLKICVKFC